MEINYLLRRRGPRELRPGGLEESVLGRASGGSSIVGGGGVGGRERVVGKTRDRVIRLCE